MAFIRVHFGNYRQLIIAGLVSLSLSSCIPGLYKFNDTNFDPAIQTFYISPFEVRTDNAPPTITQTFEEALKLKIRRESPLREDDVAPQIEFKGTVTTFNVLPTTPQAGELVAFNRLTVTVDIEYLDHFHNDEKLNWKQSFSRFADFSTEQNLLDVQTDLIQQIGDQIIEDIFNRAFTDW
jgi:hypothetical protein